MASTPRKNRSGLEGALSPTFLLGHIKSASAVNSVGGISASFGLTRSDQLSGLNATLASAMFVNSYDKMTANLTGEITQLNDESIELPYLFALNEARTGSGSGSGGISGIDVYQDGSLIKTAATELNFDGDGVGVASSSPTGVTVSVTQNSVRQVPFDNVTEVVIEDVSLYPVFTIWVRNQSTTAALFNNDMFNELLNNDSGIEYFSPEFTAKYDSVDDKLTVTLASTSSGVVAIGT